MTRLGIFAVGTLLAANLLAQDKKESADEVGRKADELVLKLYHDTYPPLYEHIQVTIEDAQPLELAHDQKSNKDVGSLIKFKVVLKNIGADKFEWVPDGVKIEVMDSQGVAIPINHLRHYESSHGDSGSYGIEKGRSDIKPIILAIEDSNVKIGTKYTIVASYVKLWEKPDVKYDCLSTTKAIEVVAARPRDSSGEKKKAP